MTDQPTNADLKASFDESFSSHAKEDHAFQASQTETNARQADVNEATLKSLAAIHARLGNLATTEDVQSITTIMENWRVGIGIVKFGWNNLGQLAVFCIAVWIIFKIGVVGAITYFFGKLP